MISLLTSNDLKAGVSSCQTIIFTHPCKESGLRALSSDSIFLNTTKAK